MKLYVVLFVLAAVANVNCNHAFFGNSIQRPIVYRQTFQFGALMYRSRIENIHYQLPAILSAQGRRIQGILAIDLTHSGATTVITGGGLGFDIVNLQMRSDLGMGLNYVLFIYA